jgi:acyl carrier protein
MTSFLAQERRNENEAVCEVIADFLGVDSKRLSATTSLSDDLGVDSIDMLALAVALELKFDVCISDEALGRVRTVGGVVPCVSDAIALRDDGDTPTLNLRK